MKKKVFSTLLSLAMAGTMLFGCAQTVMADEADPAVTIRLGNFNADGEPGQAASLKFAELANEYSNGSITVEVHNYSEFGNAPEMAEQVSIGAIEACLICEATLGEYDSRYHLVAMPYLYDGYDHAYRVVDGEFKEWVADGTLEYPRNRPSSRCFHFQSFLGSTASAALPTPRFR